MAVQHSSSINLKTDSIPKLFFTYFIPSLCAMLALSTNSTIDGIFVGHKVGKDALAAIGISWAIYPVIIAFELLFNIGAASLSSYYIGKGKPFKARMIFSSSCYFIATSGFIMGCIFYYFRYEMAVVLGASQNLLPLVVEYIGVIFLGGVFICLQGLLDTFAINDRRPKLAMVAMVSSSIANIILNYIFIFILELGLFGAALATILGHCIGFLMLLNHFITKKGDIYFITYFNFKILLLSAKNGIPHAASELNASFMILIFNHVLKDIAGDRGNAIYSVVLYIGIIIFTILLSSAQGVQPISSFNYGANRLDRVKSVLIFSALFSLFVGIVLYVLAIVFDVFLIHLFINNNDINNDTFLVGDISHALKIYYIGFIFLGFNLVVATLLQSIQKPFHSLIVTLSSTLLFTIPLVFILPSYFGISGVWASYALGMTCSSVVAFLVITHEFKKGVLRTV